MDIIQHPSPNCNSREGHGIDMLVLHYTGMKSGANALDRMCDATAEVSAHYMIEEDGRIFQMVDEEMRAWHAGKSFWRGHTNINQRSIGIEIVNPGHDFGYRDFPEVQMQSVISLCKDIVARRKIAPRNVVGHSDVAPTRKDDPGEKFDWKRLAREGVGLFPQLSDQSHSAACHLSPATLSEYGYDTADLPKAIIAFQRHFRPKTLSGQWDAECDMLLKALLDSDH
ncbi:MAG: N-acetylmuramoyl-L-alanine amidase [Alphaproteobacteria bacterium]|nr:N-acetylmuramoyl-L-alanine amidase [Alphaproteobacteria bacterium]